jgi:uncharacterized Rmd1/YagE family protein
VEKGDKFDPKAAFYDGVTKLMKIKRYHRKKGFKFQDLIKFLKKNAMNEQDEQKQQADELL